MDYIFIDELRIETLVGIYPRERKIPQTVELSLQIGLKTFAAGRSDHMADTIDYSKVVESVRTGLARQHFNLLERLAEYVASVVLYDLGASWVRVSVAKLGIMQGVKRVGVIIERNRDGQDA